MLEWPNDTTFGPQLASLEKLAGGRRLGMWPAGHLFEGSADFIKFQVQVGRILFEGSKRQRDLVGAYQGLFSAPLRLRRGRTVSDETGEDNVRHENDGREERRELALADGTCVVVREIQPGDAPALQRLVGRLSKQSVYLRFFGSMRELSEEKARYFAEVDGKDRYALVALDPEDEEEIVAVVRYDRENGTDRAEYAALVEDRLQGQGLGLALTRALIGAARERGIRDLEALVLPENRGMLHLLVSLGLPERVRRENGVKRISVDLFPEQQWADALGNASGSPG